MSYIFLVCAIIFSAMLSIMGALFNNANRSVAGSSALYNLLIATSAFISWGVVYFLNFEFDPMVLLYSILYGIFYTVAQIGFLGGLKNGSVALTSFIKQLSIAGVALWGFVFWDTPLTINVVVGIALIVLATYFCFKPDKNEKMTVSLKWAMCALMLLGGNMGCYITQRYQQMNFNGAFGSMLMFFACGFAALTCLVLYLKGVKINRSDIKISTLKFPLIAGLSSALVNLFIILMASTTLSPGVIYPAIAVGGMMLTIIFSVYICKEKLNAWQWGGLLIGMIALVLLNM